MRDILSVSKAFVKKHKTYPSMPDMAKLGFSRDQVRSVYGNLEGLHDELFIHCQDEFIDLSRESVNNLNTKKHKTFIITTALTGSTVQKNVVSSIHTFCKKNKAAPIVLVAKGSSKLAQTLDASLRGMHILTQDTELNSNLKIVGVFQSGSKTDPTSGGISRTGNRDSSIILASPKQRLFYTATGIDKLPHATMGTGAITEPQYDKRNMSGYVANHDHVMGAIVVEIVDENLFHFRQVQFDRHGGFVDLGVYYCGSKSKSMAPIAMVLGDWHAGESDPVVVQSTIALTKALKIPTWVLHDTFDGTSISHHDMGKQISLTKKAEENQLNLEKELRTYSADIEMISKLVKNVVVVKSNHDEHLERYLDEGRFIKDPQNMKLAIELAGQMINSTNILKYAVGKFAKAKNNIVWLSRGQSLRIAGIECGLHGDVGPNGSGGSLVAFEKSYGNSIVGHSHTPGILRGAWCVGTTTATSPDYGRGGASSWLNTHCLVYSNGHRQLVNCINGKFSKLI